jgi:hypothetical protein
MINKHLRFWQIIASITLLVGGCNNASGASSFSCKDVTKVQDSPKYEYVEDGTSTTNSNDKEEFKNISIGNITYNKPRGYKFSASVGQSLSYVVKATKSQSKNICVLLRAPSSKILEDSSLAALPEDAENKDPEKLKAYTLEIYALTPEVINVELSYVLGNSDRVIPLRLEVEALDRFDETKTALKSLSATVKELAKKRIENPSKDSEESNESIAHLKKLETEEDFRLQQLVKLLGIDPKDLVDDRKLIQNRRKLISAIYAYQSRTTLLYRDNNGNYRNDLDDVINGILNSKTIEAIVSDVLKLNGIRHTYLQISGDKQSKPEEIAFDRVRKYFWNISDRRCQDNWDMLSEETKKDRYKGEEMEYLEQCIKGIKKIPKPIVTSHAPLVITARFDWNNGNETQCMNFKVKPDSKLTIVSCKD